MPMQNHKRMEPAALPWMLHFAFTISFNTNTFVLAVMNWFVSNVIWSIRHIIAAPWMTKYFNTIQASLRHSLNKLKIRYELCSFSAPVRIDRKRKEWPSAVFLIWLFLLGHTNYRSTFVNPRTFNRFAFGTRTLQGKNRKCLRILC